MAVVLGSVAFAMVGMSFAAIPLYRVFCAVTGYGGTPQIGPAAAPGASWHHHGALQRGHESRPAMALRAGPGEGALKLGEQQVAFYTARNEPPTPVTGMALYNVTPDKVGKYFHKTACFCFNQQTLSPGQTMEFPVSFWVDPAIGTDPNTTDVKVITLSYTFFRSLDDAAKTGALAKAGPHVGPMCPRRDPKSQVPRRIGFPLEWRGISR